jgi:hypothetical protein
MHIERGISENWDPESILHGDANGHDAHNGVFIAPQSGHWSNMLRRFLKLRTAIRVAFRYYRHDRLYWQVKVQPV